MPVPQGQITSSEGWTTPEVVVPEEPTEVEQKEEEREEDDLQ
jgi:predicted metalloenzyme YecM